MRAAGLQVKQDWEGAAGRLRLVADLRVPRIPRQVDRAPGYRFKTDGESRL
jgi:hypothetical protein